LSWVSRDAFGITSHAATGLLLLSPEADVVAPLGAEDRATALELAATTLSGAGLEGSDRVVVALNNDGELTGALVAQAAASITAAAASVGPRGRMRLHHALEAVRATTLITTPTGAMDLLARLHLEFLIDPLDLGLRHILLAGEIASPGTHGQLTAEFEASVAELYVDPFLGLPLAHRESSQPFLTPAGAGLLALAPPNKDILLEAPHAEGLAEIVVTPRWHSALGGSTLRTGHVVRAAGGDNGMPSPSHTVGEHVLVRGRWLSIRAIATALSRVDGISYWELRIGREGTLDAAALHVTFNRGTLVTNPMWKSRIVQALVAITPISIDVVVEPEISEEARPASLTDLRGHHLGRDRTTVSARPPS
jgi:phenylacetate-CoA ligase